MDWNQNAEKIQKWNGGFFIKPRCIRVETLHATSLQINKMNIFDSYIVYLILPNLPKTDDLSENGKFLNIYLAGNIF